MGLFQPSIIIFTVISAVMHGAVTSGETTTSGEPCVFPLTYEGVVYHSCTTKNHDRPWCSTTSPYNGKWGDCAGTSSGVRTTRLEYCAFPFTYRSQKYTKCISNNHNRPWCSKTTSYDKDVKWGDCLETSTGVPCVFPFTYYGVEYKSCTTKNHNTPWCSTTSPYSGKWGNCAGTESGVKTTGGENCAFPFIYQGKEYSQCINSNHNRLWCSTTTNYDKDVKWGDCADADYEFAKAHIPELRFDGKAADHEKCFPDEAKDSNDYKCKAFNANAPIYYVIRDCGNYRKLVWWMWYGYQKNCDCCSGAHGNDWEHITINFVKEGSSWKQDSVTWFQHNGWFTRTNTATHPWIYVGKTAHGSYDNWCDGHGAEWEQDYCPGGCGYWNDWRNSNVNTHWIPHNIKPISVVSGYVANRVKDEKYFHDTALNKCIGGNWRCVIGPCGCWRNNHTFGAPYCDK